MMNFVYVYMCCIHCYIMDVYDVCMCGLHAYDNNLLCEVWNVFTCSQLRDSLAVYTKRVCHAHNI